MPDTAEIGTTDRHGRAVITDTRWDYNGTLYVTVRELIGGYSQWIGGRRAAEAVMRRLARRALDHPEWTQSSRITRRFHDDGCSYAVFAVSRLR